MTKKTNSCPNCQTPIQERIISEKCSLTKEDNPSIESILSTCTNAAALIEFQLSGQGMDPCEHCQHNQIIEIPGSFIRMVNGSTNNSWNEVHCCTNCNTTYKMTTDKGTAAPQYIEGQSLLLPLPQL